MEKARRKRLAPLLLLALMAVIVVRLSLADTWTTPLNPGHPLSQTWIDTGLNTSTYSIVTGGWLNATNLNVSSNGYFGGNVGVGTASPQAPLTFAPALGDKVQIFPSSAGSNYGYGIRAAEMQFYVPSSAHFSFNSGGDLQTSGTNEVMRILASGNVGIGTMSPGAKLEINTTGANHIKLTGGSVDAGIWTDSSSRLRMADWATGVNGLNINLSSGNVGIGTTSPANGKLQVTDGRIAITGNNVVLDLRPNSGEAVVQSAGNGASLGLYGTDNITLYTYGSGWAPKMFIASGGNVGIGTTSPAQKLDVNGGIGFGQKLAFKMGGFGYSGPSASRAIDIVTVPNVAYAAQDGFWFWGYIVQDRAQGSYNQRRVTSFSAGVDGYGYIATIEANNFGAETAPTISWASQKLTVTVNGDYTNSYVIVYAQSSIDHSVSELAWNL